MKKLILLIILLIGCGVVAMAQSYTIRGTVRSASSGETLISATVYDMLSGKGALTNAEGRYSLTLPKGKVVLRVSYVGYKTVFDTVELAENKEINVKMESSTEL
ncbi:MAG: carboxypeptidase-like regulatory domain-containing protein, partial [Bacteroidales bacterium]|nr:carboxypeptidase-like regulatory domain-containing protein [Bacteroidales bacterium]